MSATILRPQITVPLESGAVTLRDLPSQEAFEFLRRLASHAKDVLAAATSNDGRVDLQALLPKLTELVTSIEDLSTFLLTKSAGKDEEWLKQFGFYETLHLVRAALEVNLSDGLIELGKEIVARLARVVAAKATTSSSPTVTTS